MRFFQGTAGKLVVLGTFFVLSMVYMGYLLDKAGVQVARSLVGSYITSLEMAGCSLTLLRADDDLLTLWDAPVNTPGLRWAC